MDLHDCQTVGQTAAGKLVFEKKKKNCTKDFMPEIYVVKSLGPHSLCFSPKGFESVESGRFSTITRKRC